MKDSSSSDEKPPPPPTPPPPVADWSGLPPEILHEICSFIDSPFNLLRFRSVCSSWRRNAPSPTPRNLHHPHFPANTTTTTTTTTTTIPSTYSLSERNLYLITPPSSAQTPPPHHPWLIKLGRSPHGGAELFHPLSRFPIRSNFPPPPFNSRSRHNATVALSFLDLPVFEIGREFILADNSPDTRNEFYMEKVVFSWLGPQKDDYALLTIHISGRLALFRSGFPGWTIIPDMPTPYDDVCVHKGSLFAVDSVGRTVTVGLEGPSLEFAAEAVFGGDKKYLVASDEVLYLVDKFLNSEFLSELGVFEEDEDVIYELGCERAVKFEVYRLDEEEKQWVKVPSLGDRVLFIGEDCAFSASAADLGVDRGDCVVFRDDTFNIDSRKSGLGVFHLNEESITQLSEYPSFSRLFWPPPDWVGIRTLH